MSLLTQLAPREAAARVAAELLGAVHEGVPAVVVDSPPGAGKTTVGIQMAATASGLHDESVMVACWTNRQTIDFALRLAQEFSRIPVQLFLSKDATALVPAAAATVVNLTIVTESKGLEPGGVAVANAAKWSASSIDHGYTWMLVDEAYQLPDFRFQQLVPFAERYLLIGDPGQISPLIRSDVSPWGTDRAGPHVPCPEALLARHPEVRRLTLPVSWRLPQDSAAIVREAFYGFDFESGDAEAAKRLILNESSDSQIDAALEALAGPGSSLAAALLEDADIATDVDPEIADAMAEAVERLLERGAQTVDGAAQAPRDLAASDIGVVTAHRAQVAEVDRNLRHRGVPTGEGGVVVETPERWQGLQRKVMVVQHPLSGLVSTSAFDLDRGRLCVMLSRHQVACLLVGRETIGQVIDMHAHQGDRFPGMPDEEYLGWKAHHEVFSRLGQRGNLLSVGTWTKADS